MALGVTGWQVASGIVSLAVAYLTVVLLLGGIGKLGVKLNWWKPSKPLHLERARRYLK